IASVVIIDHQLPFKYTIASKSTDVMVWNAVYDAHNKVACLMLGSMTPELHRQFENVSPYEMLQEFKSMFEKQAGVECMRGVYFKKAATPQVMAIQSGRIQRANKKSLNAKRKGKGKGKGKDKSYIPKPNNKKTLNLLLKEHPAKDDTCHHCKEVGHCKRNCPAYLAELIKKKKQVGTASSSDIFIIELFSFPYKSWVYDTGCDTHISTSLPLRMNLLKHKHEVFETFKVFKNEVENQLGKTIKALRLDRGGEYISQEFKGYLKACGIIQQLTPPYTPQHNEVSERRNRTLLDMVQSMMNLTTLPLSFWDYALESAARILNMVPTKKVDKTPYELWFGKVPNLSYLKVWGCEALVKRDTPNKLQQRSVKVYLYRIPKGNDGGRAGELEEIQNEDTSPSEITSEIPMEVEGFEPPQKEEAHVRRSERPHRAPNRLCLNVEVEEHSLGDLNEPANYKAAMLDPESNKWLDAMNAEMQSMKDNQVWRLVDLPPNGKTVGSKWLFKKKTDMDGNVYTYKVHLVAKGFTQTYGVDYEETFSPVADIRAIRILIAIAAFYDYEIWQMDVKTAFLNGYLDEDIYMVQPEGFIDPKHPRKVCKLQRSIYGLKQASRSWNKRFDEEIKRFGFTQNLDEPCVYQKASGRNVTFLILYVDDIIIMGNHIPSLQSVKAYLGKCFAMKYLGEAAFILGIKIYRDRSMRLIGLCQSAYMDKILKIYRMDNSKRGYIPINPEAELRVDCYCKAGFETDRDEIKSQT
ncbi:retrotransposon protein, putative, ty1-copia subclass, partial [Tanacetum coccineum]